MGRTIDIQYNDPAAIERAVELKLSVLLESDSFFYWATDENNEVVRIEQVEGLDLNPLQALDPQTINVSFTHATGYLIPGIMHDPRLVASMMQTTDVVNEWTSFKLDQPDAFLYLPKNECPPEPRLKGSPISSFQPLTRYFLFPSFSGKGLLDNAFVHLHIMESLVYLAVYRGGKLLLWQSVPLDSAYELQYYTLLIFDQFKMDRKEIPLLLSGRLAAGSQMYNLLYPYFAQIRWATFPDDPGTPKLPGTIPSHYLADLWLIHQCA